MDVLAPGKGGARTIPFTDLKICYLSCLGEVDAQIRLTQNAWEAGHKDRLCRLFGSILKARGLQVRRAGVASDTNLVFKLKLEKERCVSISDQRKVVENIKKKKKSLEAARTKELR